MNSVLLVDADPDSAHALRAGVERESPTAHLVECPTLAAAVRVLSDIRFDAIIVHRPADVPIADAVEVLHTAAPGTRLVVLTTSTEAPPLRASGIATVVTYSDWLNSSRFLLPHRRQR